MYKYVINPNTKRKVSINGKIGKFILINYINRLIGGSEKKPSSPRQPSPPSLPAKPVPRNETVSMSHGTHGVHETHGISHSFPFPVPMHGTVRQPLPSFLCSTNVFSTKEYFTSVA